jgi:hypothetical protein
MGAQYSSLVQIYGLLTFLLHTGFSVQYCTHILVPGSAVTWAITALVTCYSNVGTTDTDRTAFDHRT